MAKTTSIKLSDHFDALIASQLKSGSYKNASELIREGLRKLEEDDLKLQALRKILESGREDIEEGRFSSYASINVLKAGINREIDARLTE